MQQNIGRVITISAVIVGVILAWPGGAERARAAAPPTELSLSVTGEASHPPDAMRASLLVSATASDAAGAQNLVNVRTKSALAALGRIKGVVATTGSYSVYPADRQRKTWLARQSISLGFPASPTAPSAKPVLVVIGQLQDEGLMLESLDGTLQPASASATRDAAIRDAVKTMNQEAAGLAKALGMSVGPIIQIGLNVGGSVSPMIQTLQMGARTASAPVAAPADVIERVSLSAKLQLLPVNH